MRSHHQSTLAAAQAFFTADPQVLALILGGSVAKECATETSDVDVMVVLTEEGYRKRRSDKTYASVYQNLATYEGGYVDAKFMDEPFLEAAADRGSEPTRDAFTCAQVVWSRIPNLDEVVRRIPVYPEAERESKMRRFYSSALLQNFFVGEAERRQDPFLLMHSCATMALFAGRLILAHNRMLFPSNKRMMERVAIAADQPSGFMSSLQRVVTEPGSAAVKALTDSLNDFRDWGVDWLMALGLYVEDNEFNWMENPPPLAES